MTFSLTKWNSSTYVFIISQYWIKIYRLKKKLFSSLFKTYLILNQILFAIMALCGVLLSAQYGIFHPIYIFQYTFLKIRLLFLYVHGLINMFLDLSYAKTIFSLDCLLKIRLLLFTWHPNHQNLAYSPRLKTGDSRIRTNLADI